MSCHVIIPPEVEPVSLEEAKNYIRVDHNLDDGLIEQLITGQRYYIEQIIGRSLITQRLEVHGTFPLKLERPPVQKILKVTCGSRTLEEEAYKVLPALHNLSQVHIGSSSKTLQGTVLYQAGYGDKSEDVPMTLRLAILYRVHMYYTLRLAPHEQHVCTHTYSLLAPFQTIEL